MVRTQPLRPDKGKGATPSEKDAPKADKLAAEAPVKVTKPTVLTAVQLTFLRKEIDKVIAKHNDLLRDQRRIAEEERDAIWQREIRAGRFRLRPQEEIEPKLLDDKYCHAHSLIVLTQYPQGLDKWLKVRLDRIDQIKAQVQEEGAKLLRRVVLNNSEDVVALLNEFETRRFTLNY